MQNVKYHYENGQLVKQVETENDIVKNRIDYLKLKVVNGTATSEEKDELALLK